MRENLVEAAVLPASLSQAHKRTLIYFSANDPLIDKKRMIPKENNSKKTIGDEASKVFDPTAWR
jgi:hypothetical protein